MSKQTDCCSVRRNDRWDCDLVGTLRVDDAHSEQVVFSRAVADNNGALPIRIIDCSMGGLSLHSGVYLPRGTRVIVAFSTNGTPDEPEHELHMRVQRGSMVERTPAYYHGLSVLDQAESVTPLASLIALAEKADGSVGEAA